MKNQLTAKYLGYQAGKFKFEDNHRKPIMFNKCNRDIIEEFELLSETNINQNFKIWFLHFQKEEIKIINELRLA